MTGRSVAEGYRGMWSRYKRSLALLAASVLVILCLYGAHDDPAIESVVDQTAAQTLHGSSSVLHDPGGSRKNGKLSWELLHMGRSDKAIDALPHSGRNRNILSLQNNNSSIDTLALTSPPVSSVGTVSHERLSAVGNRSLAIHKPGRIIDLPPSWYYAALTTTTPAFTKSWEEPVNCSLIYREDPWEIKHALKRRAKVRRENTDIKVLSDLADSCDAFIKTRAYVTEPVAQEEAEFPLAFAIRMHYKPLQAERLLRAIYRPQNFYCIYIDKKAGSATHEFMAKIAGCFPNVFLASHTNDYIYASFSPVEADMQCMQDLLHRSDSWKYFLNMAGTEFPIKNNLEIVRVLKVLNGTNDVEQYPFPDFYERRIKYKYKAVGKSWVATGREKEPFTQGNITLYKGCSYNSLSRKFVEWILSDDLAQKFIYWSRDLHSPDEVVWGSLNALPQAPGGYPDFVAQTAKTFLSRDVIWYSGVAYCHGHRMIRGICILSLEDLHWLSNSWSFFANKFDTSYDPIVLDCLEESLQNRMRHPEKSDAAIKWDSVKRTPHVKRALHWGAR